ncbi:MAG: valine--tRNA ligase, partial [Anaerolineaceae bacterium]
DYQIGKKHDLEFISMLDQTAHVNENGGPYAGMDRFDCRKKLWADMQAAGLVIKEEPYTLNVPRSQRGGEIVEPMISTQWFIKIKPLADAALEAVRDGRIKIVPERFTKVYFNWLENIQDWCISRQLWWGHRIPVWYCEDCGEMTCTRQDPTECSHCHSKKIHQDEDVLDTWFSSGLWPFSTLGWPEQTPDLAYFYPTTVMETGYDILFFWVARMIMFGLEFTGKPPFNTIYLHGLIRDEHGQKMSKSKGNGIDPLVLMDELGTDALRLSVLVGSTPGNDMNIGVKKVESNRNFANKVWNAGRYVIGALENAPAHALNKPEWTLADRWIWEQMQQLIRDVERLFNNYQYGEAGRQIYDFFWNIFADWYVEISKIQITKGGDIAYYTAQRLVAVLDTCLRLLHPFTPFVTEELWGHLKRACQEKGDAFNPPSGWSEALMLAEWPKAVAPEPSNDKLLADFPLIMDVIRATRNLRLENKVPPKTVIHDATFTVGNKLELFQSQKVTISGLAQLDSGSMVFQNAPTEKPITAGSTVINGIEITIPLANLVDEDAERGRLQKELEEAESQIARLENLLASDFAKKAPAPVVDKERQKLAAFKETVEKLKAQLK